MRGLFSLLVIDNSKAYKATIGSCSGAEIGLKQKTETEEKPECYHHYYYYFYYYTPQQEHIIISSLCVCVCVWLSVFMLSAQSI